MKVKFNKDIRVAGIGIVPWLRLGPERWIENYRIASLYGWDMGGIPGAPTVSALADQTEMLPDLEKLNTASLLQSPEFRTMLLSRFPGYSFMTYKPVDPPKELLDAGCTFLFTDQRLSRQLENKAAFRQLFHEEIPFPAYDVIKRAAISATGESFRALMRGRDTVVVQDEQLSGGRGTYIVREPADLERALAAFEALDSGTHIVLSDYIADAHERSVQCVVTKYGVFVGPLQKQIVRHPLLANMAVREGDRFCGGELAVDDAYKGSYPVIRDYAERIGRRLQELGYRGIFGLDCLVDDSGDVFVLEVNPRITGMTPLLTMLYRGEQDIPFYLLHLLELAKVEYTLSDWHVDPNPPEGGLMILHSQKPGAVIIRETPRSGSYDVDGNFLAKQYRLETQSADTRLLVQRYTPPNFKTKPGGRLISVFANKPVLDQADKLKPEITKAIASTYDRITLEELPL